MRKEMNDHQPSTGRRDTQARGGRRAKSILLASTAAVGLLGASGCTPAKSPAAAPISAVEHYLAGFKALNATETAQSVAPYSGVALPSLPELVIADMKAKEAKYGKLVSWRVTSSQVDATNGQAFITESVASEKTIVTMKFDVRKIDGKWLVYNIQELDRVRNPALETRTPFDIGKPKPFDIR
jgi:hypothetical protein